MKRKFYFVFDSSTNSPKSMELDRNRDIYVKVAEPQNQMLGFLWRLHVGRRINQHVNLPGKQIWGLPIKRICSDRTVEYWVILTNTIALWYGLGRLKRIKKQSNIYLALILQDDLRSWDGIRIQEYIGSGIFDYIFTFDPEDARKVKMLFSNIPFIPRSISVYPEIAVDLYFAGGNNGRLDILHGVFSSLIQHNLIPFFRITRVERKEQITSDKIIYNRPVPYEQIVKELLTSNCILEILKSTQTAATLRYYEAVCYNKKLLTNNKNIVNLPFYNPEWMHVFENPEDIDWGWVKERVPVDYHYDGRFSPIHLVDRIIELEEQKEAQSGGEKD